MLFPCLSPNRLLPKLSPSGSNFAIWQPWVDHLFCTCLTLTELLCELLHLLLVGLGLLCDRLRVPDGLHARVVRPDLVLRRLVHLVPLNGMEINMNIWMRLAGYTTLRS